MRATGATRDDFGKLAVAQRANARRNPLALLRGELTLADYLAARPIAEPHHLFDCVMPCAGADGFLVMTETRARTLGLPFVRLRGAIERHNAFPDDPVALRGGWAMDRDALWAQAGLGPSDVQLAETYDDYPVISMLQFEGLGFCGAGDGPAFVRRHDFTVDGSFPHNTGGGQLSMGQAGAAGGYLGLVEAMRQVLGNAAGRQVADARHALVSGFGMINYDRGLCSAAAVLGRA
jgi:acetyl-CoA acetyltransferase